MKKILILAAFSLLVTGCAQQTFVMAPQSTDVAIEESQHFFIEGIGQEKEIDAAAVCGSADKVGKVEVQQTFINGLIATVTFGIYTPREARVFCKS